MSSINNNNKSKTNKEVNKKSLRNDFFNLDIKDDIFDPFKDDFFNFDSFENKMFRNIFNIFDTKKETQKPKEVEEPKEVKPEEKIEEEKEEEINTNNKEEEINTNTKKEEINTNTIPKEENKGTIYSKIYRYNNINGKEERYSSQSIKQINNEHNISEIKEIYNNSDGIYKSAYQRGLDNKTTRFIKEKKMEEEEINTNTKKEEEINTNTKPKEENKGTIYSKVYRYNNINGKEERYTSQSIKQINNEHNISEIKEIYNNSDGIYKSAYQRGLDDKTTRFIKEKNIKTGKKNQKKIIKGLEENEINDFNKTYNDYCKQCGFKKHFKEFDPFGINRKHLLSDTTNNLFFHRLLF